jgi:hypothetical protein
MIWLDLIYYRLLNGILVNGEYSLQDAFQYALCAGYGYPHDACYQYVVPMWMPVASTPTFSCGTRYEFVLY